MRWFVLVLVLVLVPPRGMARQLLASDAVVEAHDAQPGDDLPRVLACQTLV